MVPKVIKDAERYESIDIQFATVRANAKSIYKPYSKFYIYRLILVLYWGRTNQIR